MSRWIGEGSDPDKRLGSFTFNNGDAVNAEEITSNELPRRRLRWVLAGGTCLLFIGSTVAVADSMRGDPPVVTPDQVADLRAELDSQLPSASRSQRLALLDGVIDRSEMLLLGENASSCSVASGSRPIRLDVDEKSVEWEVNFGSGDNVDELMAATDKCWFEHVGLAERYYGLQNVPPVSEQVRINELVVDCLAREGYEGTGWPATDAQIDPSVEAECVELAENS